MKNRMNINSFLNPNRKVLYTVLCILVLSVLTLTIVYAALSTTLQINGQAEVMASNWDIYLDNIQLNSNSASKNLPTITTPNTASFTSTLNIPGDFYEFTIDVVNNGTIDAMIESVTKTPELTDAQKKYLNYIVEYQNGELISTKQLVEKKSFVRLKVRIEFRNDISPSELPTQEETLNLSFRVNYVQSDENGTGVKDDGVLKNKLDIISGNLETVGSEVAIGHEHFYIISGDEDSVTMLAKYNLYVGGKYENDTWKAYGDEATGIQDETMLGYLASGQPYNGIITFSQANYWYDNGLKLVYGTEYPAYVYDENSSIYTYINNYKIYLESQGMTIDNARLIKQEELISLGCTVNGNSCTEAPEWVYGTSYWSGSAYSSIYIRGVASRGTFGNSNYNNNSHRGIRPVITISKSQF